MLPLIRFAIGLDSFKGFSATAQASRKYPILPQLHLNRFEPIVVAHRFLPLPRGLLQTVCDVDDAESSFVDGLD